MNTQQLDSILQNLHESSTEVIASAIVSCDGIMLNSHLNPNTNENHAAAISAAMLNLAERMTDTLGGSTTERVMIVSDVGYVIVTAVNDELLLSVVAKADAKLGMVFYDIKQTIEQITSAVSA